MQWKLVHLVRAWGWSRTIGMAMIALAALVYFLAQQTLSRPLETSRARLAELEKRQPAPVEQTPRISGLGDLPPSSRAVASLTGLQNLAHKLGLSQESGHYKLELEGNLVRYKINLPLTGDYPAIRRYLSQALAQYPNLALDSVRISREQIGMSEVDAALQFSLYFRP
jgi:hypothetical protein